METEANSPFLSQCKKSLRKCGIPPVVNTYSGHVEGWIFDAAQIETVVFGPGPTLSIPVRASVADGFFLRGGLELGVNSGQDRVEWQRLDGAVTVYSDEHWTLLTDLGLLVGPEVRIIETRSSRVLWGVE